MYLEFYMRCLISYYNNLFFAKQLDSLKKKIPDNTSVRVLSELFSGFPVEKYLLMGQLRSTYFLTYHHSHSKILPSIRKTWIIANYKMNYSYRKGALNTCSYLFYTSFAITTHQNTLIMIYPNKYLLLENLSDCWKWALILKLWVKR